VTVPEHVGVIRSMILNHSRISAKRIVDTLEISREVVGCVIRGILDMRKILDKCVAKCLNGDQKRDRMLASQPILDRFRPDSGIF
jgi:hypothetical protein